MNKAQFEAQRTELMAEVKRIESATDLSPAAKVKALGELEPALSVLEAAAPTIGRSGFDALRAFGTSSGTAADDNQPHPGTHSGSAAPLDLDGAAVKALFDAATSRQSIAVRTKTAADITSLIPSVLVPNVLGPVHEGRLLDHLPTASTAAPSVEYIRHASTTGSPATVAPGGAKPELTLVTSQLVATARKVAAWIGVTHESLSDFSSFQGYVHNELIAQIVDAENAQLLSGDGTGTNLTGILNTSGLLTASQSTDTGTDCLAKAIKALRVGSSLAVADKLVIHPTDFLALRMQKDSQNRYILEPDPTAAQAHSVWGLDVVETTAIAAGTALRFDSRKLGRVWVRESLTVSADPYSAATNNILKLIGEERIALAVERPTAGLKITWAA